MERAANLELVVRVREAGKLNQVIRRVRRVRLSERVRLKRPRRQLAKELAGLADVPAVESATGESEAGDAARGASCGTVDSIEPAAFYDLSHQARVGVVDLVAAQVRLRGAGWCIALLHLRREGEVHRRLELRRHDGHSRHDVDRQRRVDRMIHLIE